MNVGNLISGSSLFSKSNFNMWKFMVHVLLKSGLEDFDHYFASVWDECICVVVWAFLGIALFWEWNEIPVLVWGVFFGYVLQMLDVDVDSI